MKIPFSPPYVDDDVIREVNETLRSGWITTGPKVQALEDLLCDFTGCQAVLGVNSWTSGAMLLLKRWGIGEGDEVIVPAYTYSATALAVLNIGAQPVMVDCGEDFNISLEGIQQAITSKTKAIMPVDIGGWPCDYDAINEIAKSKEVRRNFRPNSEWQKKLGRPLVVADAAHSLGAKYKGKYSGNLCDVAIFSLHAVKNITTAEGGAICLNLPNEFDNQEVRALLRRYSLNGQTKDAFTKTNSGGWRYDIVEQGMKCNLPDVNAAIGLAQLRKYNQLLAERRRVFEHYHREFSKKEWALLPQGKKEHTESSYHLYALRFKSLNEKGRDVLIKKIQERGAGCNVHFVPMPMLTLFKNLGYDSKDFPKAFSQYQNLITLPIYPQLTENEVDYVIKVVTDEVESEISKNEAH